MGLYSFFGFHWARANYFLALILVLYLVKYFLQIRGATNLLFVSGLVKITVPPSLSIVCTLHAKYRNTTPQVLNDYHHESAQLRTFRILS